MTIKLTQDPLNVQEALDAARADDAGAVALFVGTVRNASKGKTVERLEYEAYETMALKRMNAVAEEIERRWQGARAAIHHRYGTLGVGEIAVVVAVATPHRAEAFEACKYAIDTLKQTVPIWKKERFEDGDVWVTPTP